jgi:glutamate:GABA antiporter
MTTAATEHSTRMAQEERRKLIRSFGRVDMLLFLVCAIVGLDTLGQVASYGAQTFTWVVVLGLLFLLPYGLVMAELGTAFPQEGGQYEWMKLAWGRFAAGMGAVLYWISNPLWVGGSLAFISTQAWSTYIHPVGSQTLGDYVFKLGFIWGTVIVAIMALRRGKWIPNLGAIVRIAVLGLFSVTVVIYAIDHGVHGYGVHDFGPSSAVFIGLVPLLLFNYVGFELQSGAAEEMENPRRDVPVAVARGGLIAMLCYAIPIFGIVSVLPTTKVSGIAGFLDAVNTTFSVYGSAHHFMLQVMAIMFIFALATSGAAWIIGSDRVLAVAGYDGGFAGWFGAFHSRLGTPVRVNVLSGVVASAFMVSAQLLNSGSNANTFVVVLYMATSTGLLSYILIFPALIKLRYSHADVPRPYRVPFGMAGAWICGGLTLGWIILGSWIAIFPDTIENLVGAGYNFHDYWGISRVRFETFTLGTLVVIAVIGIAGYLAGADVRSARVDVPLDAGGNVSSGEAGVVPSS